jgi:phosphoribosylformimino-5-aminoimidazole carboxamide ribonucleotide (ProFAR) isomerase
MNNEDDQIEIIPAVYMYKGLPVIKGKETYEPMKNEDGEDLGINELLKKLSDRFKKALIMDLNGINRDRPQLDIFKTISTDMELWVDGGTRIGTGVIDVLVAGADYVVLGTKTLLGLDELEKANELSENVIFDINFDEGIVSPKKVIREMTPSSLMQEAKNIGIKNVIFTDLKNTTADSEFNLNAARQVLSSDLNIYFHGRFTEPKRTFSKMDIKGLIYEVDTLIENSEMK